jgi:hypothetical protein
MTSPVIVLCFRNSFNKFDPYGSILHSNECFCFIDLSEKHNTSRLPVAVAIPTYDREQVLLDTINQSVG